MVPFAPGPVAAARPVIATTRSPAMVTSTITQRGSARRVLNIAHLRASAGNFDRTTGWSASRPSQAVWAGEDSNLRLTDYERRLTWSDPGNSRDLLLVRNG